MTTRRHSRVLFTVVIGLILAITLAKPLPAQEIASGQHKIYLPEVMKMAQISRPQQGRQTDYPDAGGYTANQWARMFRLFTGDYDTQGVFQRHLDALAVTNPSGVTIRVAKGAALVNGHFMWNEDETDPEGNASNVDFTPSTPAVSRTDKVVIVQNNSDAAYDGTADYGSAVLEFPTDLTDYLSASSVPPHSTRLAILTGIDGGAARALTQDADIDGDIWMIEIARYDISSAPAISNLTDYREYVEHLPHGTVRRFVQAQYAYNETDAAEITSMFTGGIIGWEFPNNKECYGYSLFQIPDDFISDMVVRAVFEVPGSGADDIYAKVEVDYGADNQSPTTHQDANVYAAETVTAGFGATYEAVRALTLTSAARGDFLWLKAYRDATNVLDTIGAGVGLIGFQLSYTGVPATAEP